MFQHRDAHLDIIREVAAEILPPDPVLKSPNPITGLVIASAAIPSVAAIGNLIWAGPSTGSWLLAGASWLYLTIVLLARLRHVAHYRLLRHPYQLKSGMHTYYLISQGVPRPEPDSAHMIAQHFPEATRTVRNLRQTIAPDKSGHFPSRDLQFLRARHDDFYAVLWETQRLGRLYSSCDRCRWWRRLHLALRPIPFSR